MKALVLGGGSMKGAYQVGAIRAVLESGFVPDMIYGISVGSLNTAFLAHEMGHYIEEKKPIDWSTISRNLMGFWLEHITTPQSVGTLRNKALLGVNTLMSQFHGLLDSAPLHNLVRGKISLDTVRKAPIKVKVGCVNVSSGEMVYSTPADDDFIKYVLASSSIPLIMPSVEIGEQGDRFIDGAIREVTPLRQAIADGAKDIVSISCHSKKIYHRDGFNPNNLISLAEKVRDITVNQMVNNDIVWAENYAERSALKGEAFSLKVVRPNEPLFLDMLSFTSDDISRLMLQGYKEGLMTYE